MLIYQHEKRDIPLLQSVSQINPQLFYKMAAEMSNPISVSSLLIRKLETIPRIPLY